MSAIRAWGALHILFAVYGVFSGRTGFFVKAAGEVFPSMKWVTREQSAVFFWGGTLVHVAFGAFLFWYASWGHMSFPL